MNNEITFDALFVNSGSNTVHRHWMVQDTAMLDGAAWVVYTHAANPWTFAADRRHFEQFAEKADMSAFSAMSEQQRRALCYWYAWDGDNPVTTTRTVLLVRRRLVVVTRRTNSTNN